MSEKRKFCNKCCPYCGAKVAYFNDVTSFYSAEVFKVSETDTYDVIVKCRKCKNDVGIKIKKHIA